MDRTGQGGWDGRRPTKTSQLLVQQFCIDIPTV